MRQLIATLSLLLTASLQIGAQTYCVPQTSFGCSFGDQIVNFSTSGGSTNISNLNSGCSTGNYSYDSIQAVTAEIGGSFDFQVQSGPTFSQGIVIWIDWNQDFDFEDTGEQVWTSPSWSTQLNTGTIQIPTTQAGGTYRIRVRCSYNSIPSSPCGQQTYGEVEEYNLVLEAGSEVIGICYGDTPPAFNSTDSATGGSGTYTYIWEQSSDMGSTWANAVGQFDSIDYDYGLTLTDTLFFRRLVVDQTCGDSAYSNVIEIHVPDSLQLDSVSISNATCFGTASGAIDMSISGGALPYSYSWSDGDSIQDPTNLAAGSYTVTVTDNFNCSITRTFSVQQPDSLVVDALVNNQVSCNGLSDASISTQVTGGTAPFSYSWSNGDTIATSNNLSIGTYTVTITDANGCTAMDSVVVTEPTTLAASSSVLTQLSCTGANDGSIMAMGSGGTAPYSYLWNNGDTLATTSSLDSGTYTVTITDANGCTAMSTSTIILLDTIRPTINTQNATVYLDASGQGALTAAQVDNGTSDSCGIASLSISQSSFNCTHIGSNTITFYASDVNGNNDSITTTVMVVDTVKPIVLTQNDTIYLDGNGEAQITVMNIENGSNDACGIQSLSLDSTDFNSSEIGNNLVTLTVTDVNGNSATAAATVTVLDTLTPIARAQNLTIYLDQNGSVSITPQMADNGSTDNSPLTFSLSQSTFNCGDEGLNLETLTVTDAGGNVNSTTFLVDVKDTIRPTLVSQSITVQLGATGQASIAASQLDNGSFDNCANQLFYTVSKTSFDCSNLGTNIVTITITDTEGNSTTGTDTVFVEDNLNPTVQTQNLTLQIDQNGQATLTPQMVNNGSADNCSIDSLWISQMAFDCSHIGTNSITFSATDPSGNVSTTNVIITIEDKINPVAQAQNITLYLDQNGTASLTAQMVDNGSADNCSISSLSIDQTSFSCSDVGANTITLTASDPTGNSNTSTATITVLDTNKPMVITQNLTLQLDQNGAASITPQMVDNGSTDNCGIQSMTLDQSSFNCNDLNGPVMITLTVTDNNGNVQTQTAQITLEDQMAPIAQAQNVTVYLDANGSATLTPQMVNNGSSDNCSIDSLWISQTAFDCSHIGTNGITLSVEDPSGNLTTTNATITVEDTTRPTVVTQNVSLYLDANGSASLTAQMVDNGSADNCSISSLSIDQTSFTCSDAGANTITLNVVDSSGNNNTSTAIITVLDTNKPVVITQNLTVQLGQNGSASITPQMVDNGSTDNCTIQSMTLDQTSFSCSDLNNPITVTLTVTDNSGNVQTQTAQITVEDQIAPIAQSQNLTVYLGANGTATITPQMVDNGSNDNCAIDSLNLDISVFDCADLGQNLIILTVTDSSGNSSTANAFITILDTVKPTIDNLPSTITAYATANQCATTVQWPTLTASDNCNSTFINTSQINGGLFNIGTTTVLVNAFDASGNTITQNFDVIVLDTVSPVITGLPFAFNTMPNANTCDAQVSWTAPTAFDNCGTATLTSTHNPGATFPVGTTTVTYTATDGDGNSSTASFTVTVNDVIDPTINNTPANITQTADAGTCGALINFTAPTVTDNCTGATLASSHTSGSVFPVGTTTVSYTATDGAGNTTQTSFDITITDDEKPIVLSVPANDTVGPCNAAYVYPLPTASDNCGNITVTQLNGLPSGNVFPIGITQNTFRISDDSGNDTVVSFTIVIVPQGQPQLPNLLEICENAPAVDIALGQNIQWSGNGVVNQTVFNPFQAGFGRHTLSYQFTDDQGCVATGSISVTVLPVPIDPVIVQIASTTLSTQGGYASYQWYKDGQILNGETGPTLNYSTAGNYQVIVGNVNGCQVFGEGFVVGNSGGGIGLEENLLSKLSIYPNPTNGRVTIDLNQFIEQDITISLHSIDGKELLQRELRSNEEGRLELDLSHLPRATYFMQINGQQHVVVRKIIIQ
jgi:hypothetical protein